MGLRWARRAKGEGPIAFVFSGGGPLGAVQVGLLQALIEKKVFPDLVVGASVGALNAVFIAANPTLEGVEALRGVWARMRKDDLFPGGRLVSAWHAVRRGSFVFSNTGLRRIIDTDLGAETFEELRIPAHVVATKLAGGDEVWFSSGALLEPLLASAAMPGVFPPVTIDGATYIDGGVANNLPVTRAVELGARRMYVLNVHAMSQPRPLNRPYDFMMHGLVLARAQRFRQDIEKCRDHAEVIEFPVIDVGHVAFTNLSQTNRLIEAGYAKGRKFLEGAAQHTEKRPATGARAG